MVGEAAMPVGMREKHGAIWAVLEPFCREHLNEEYREVCRRLLGVLARKRPSPLVNGTAAVWACGIVRTVGWVNFLDDKEQKPHMKMTEVDRILGVSSGTGQGKSKTIRQMLKIGTFDPSWTLPSRMDENPMIWLVQMSNGMIMDVRYMPRKVQVEAFEAGMIPYIPADRKEGDGG
jgi:hypothetical protein